MLDKINGISSSNIGNNLHENSFSDSKTGRSEFGMPPQQGKQDASGISKLEGILPALMKVIEQLMALLQGESGKDDPSGSGGKGAGKGAVTPNGESGGIKPEQSTGGSEKIPAPTEHIQNLNLGGKTVTIGGDGTASAGEVQATADSIQNLYQNSDTFRNMIDSSSDPSFEVSVGKKGDNTSWGNSEGRVFMNINNINPGDSDTFQSLLGHEFAHASIDLDHGAQIEGIESAVAAEA